MLVKFFALSTLVAAVFAATCTDEQLSAHGLTGTRQTVLFSRLEENSDATFSLFDKREGEGGFVCTAPASVIYPDGPAIKRTDNKLFARCTGKRDSSIGSLLGARGFCPCVGNTCDNGAACIDAGCPGGCGCVYETGPPGDPGGLNCGCA